MEINGEIIEEYGFKAAQKGFFKQWQHLTSFLCTENAITLDKAAEIAYDRISLETIKPETAKN